MPYLRLLYSLQGRVGSSTFQQGFELLLQAQRAQRDKIQVSEVRLSRYPHSKSQGLTPSLLGPKLLHKILDKAENPDFFEVLSLKKLTSYA